MKRKFVSALFSPLLYPKEFENFIIDMAMNGWILSHVYNIAWCFKKCDPKRIQIKVYYHFVKDNELQQLNDDGYTLIMRTKDLSILYTESLTLEENQIEDDQIQEIINKKYSILSKYIYYIFLVGALICSLMIISDLVRLKPINLYVDFNSFYYLFNFFIYAVICIFVTLFNNKVRELNNGQYNQLVIPKSLNRISKCIGFLSYLLVYIQVFYLLSTLVIFQTINSGLYISMLLVLSWLISQYHLYYKTNQFPLRHPKGNTLSHTPILLIFCVGVIFGFAIPLNLQSNISYTNVNPFLSQGWAYDDTHAEITFTANEEILNSYIDYSINILESDSNTKVTRFKDYKYEGFSYEDTYYYIINLSLIKINNNNHVNLDDILTRLTHYR